MPYKAREPDRDVLVSKVSETASLGAFVGCFAYYRMNLPAAPAGLDYVLFVLSCFAAHACICSSLTSAVLLRVLYLLHDDEVDKWASQPINKFLLELPLIKFGMGCPCFLITVILTSWRDLQEDTPSRIIALIIGVISVSTVITTAAIVMLGPSKVSAVAGSRVASSVRVLSANP